jgi:predicted ester cyclase
VPVVKAIRESHREGFKSVLIGGVARLTTRRTFARNTVCAAAGAITGYIGAPPKTEASGARSRGWNNKAIVDRWFTEFWGQSWNPGIVSELCAPDILLQYLLQPPLRGCADVTMFMTKLREAFPDVRVWPATELVADGDYVVARWVGSGTHTGAAYCDFLVGDLPAASGQRMRLSGTTVLRIQNDKIAEQIGLDDGVTASLQLGLTGAAW